jgi:hypothetical protein
MFAVQSPQRRPFQRPHIQQEHHKRQRHQHRLAHQPQHKQPKRRPIPNSCSRFIRLAREAPIRQQREQREENAQDILPLRDPRHRFHMQWVNRKQGCHHPTPADFAGGFRQQKEQKPRV